MGEPKTMSEPLTQIIRGEFTMSDFELHEVQQRTQFDDDEPNPWYASPYLVVPVLFIIDVGLLIWNSRSAPHDTILLIEKIFSKFITLYPLLLVGVVTFKRPVKAPRNLSTHCAFEFRPQEMQVIQVNDEQTILTQFPYQEIDEVHDFPDNLVIKAEPYGQFLVRKASLTSEEVEMLRSFFNRRLRKRFYTRRKV